MKSRLFIPFLLWRTLRKKSANRNYRRWKPLEYFQSNFNFDFLEKNTSKYFVKIQLYGSSQSNSISQHSLKMEILFTWIENYRNIQNQGVNFSADLIISFDHNTNSLTIIENERSNYIPSFFGAFISNITVIVGENGTGKTSILNIGDATFYLGRKGTEYFVVCRDEELLDRINCNLNISKHKELRLNDTLVIEYSNFIDNVKEELKASLFHSSCLHNFSTNKLAHGIINYNEENLHAEHISYFSSDRPIIREIKMHISEIEQQMCFLLEGNNNEKMTFKTPDKLEIIFNVDTELEYLEKYDKELTSSTAIRKDTGISYILDSFTKNHLTQQFKKKNFKFDLKVSDKEYTLFLLRWSIFLSFINSFTAGNGPTQWLYFDDNWDTKPIEKWFDYFFTKYIVLEENYMGVKYDEQIQAWADNAVNFINQFEEILNTELVHFSYPENTYSFGKQVVLTIDISQEKYKAFLYQRLVQNYKKIQEPIFWRNDNRPFLSFAWRGFSTGELAMLRIFSRFNTIRDIVVHKDGIDLVGGKITHLLFLIDEGEIGLHPAWQQRFLNTLIENLPLMFADVGVKSIQLILTTHSPFILSDVPNNHVIFLEKNVNGECVIRKNPLQDKKMTFGANIHSLLSDGFFMKEGLIGDFAKKKINQLIDDLIENRANLSSERRNEIKLMIPLIGEPIIRKKVMELYNEQMNLSIEDRIKSLEADIQKLKATQNDSNKKK